MKELINDTVNPIMGTANKTPINPETQNQLYLIIPFF
jgi:hypothetical protein